VTFDIIVMNIRYTQVEDKILNFKIGSC